MTKRDKVMRGSLRNERTSSRVGSIAGRVMERLQEIRGYAHIGDHANGQNPVHVAGIPVCTVDEFEAVMASALTQRPVGPVLATAKPKRKK